MIAAIFTFVWIVMTLSGLVVMSSVVSLLSYPLPWTLEVRMAMGLLIGLVSIPLQSFALWLLKLMTRDRLASSISWWFAGVAGWMLVYAIGSLDIPAMSVNQVGNAFNSPGWLAGGAILGFLQWLTLRRKVPSPYGWTLLTALALYLGQAISRLAPVPGVTALWPYALLSEGAWLGFWQGLLLAVMTLPVLLESIQEPNPKELTD